MDLSGTNGIVDVFEALFIVVASQAVPTALLLRVLFP